MILICILISAFVAFLGGGISSLTSFLFGVLIFFGFLILFFAVGTIYIMLKQNYDGKNNKSYRKSKYIV